MILKKFMTFTFCQDVNRDINAKNDCFRVKMWVKNIKINILSLCVHDFKCLGNNIIENFLKA